MKDRIHLGFLIGLFFVLAGLCLLISVAVRDAGTDAGQINFFCGSGYVLFGVVMMLLPSGKGQGPGI